MLVTSSVAEDAVIKALNTGALITRNAAVDIVNHVIIVSKAKGLKVVPIKVLEVLRDSIAAMAPQEPKAKEPQA